MTYTKLSESEVRQILSDRGLDDSAIQDMIDSFDGPIYQGNMGDVFTITESSPGDASGVFVTRGSAGATATDRTIRQKAEAEHGGPAGKCCNFFTICRQIHRNRQ